MNTVTGPLCGSAWPLGVARGGAAFPSGCVLHYQITEGSGTTLADISGNGNTGTLNGGVTWSGSAGSYSLSLDGSATAYVTLPSVSIGTVHTVSGWVNFSASASQMLTRFASTGYAGYFASGAINYSTNLHNVSVSYTQPTNQWHHYAVVRNGTAITFYVDGVQQGTTQTLGDNESETTSKISDPSRPINGSLGAVALFSRALSATEISTLYALGRNG